MNERIRLERLCSRDGLEAARQWAQWAAGLYRQSLSDPMHYASQPDWRPLFERSLRELTLFAESGILS
ncbi:hypothetical protein [Nitrospira moscoviensis]|nr:hypothetical protein [Nitrospira moscoviensis]